MGKEVKEPHPQIKRKGGSWKLHYIFELCPKCMDKLVERKIDDFQEYIAGYCPNCGSMLENVFSGKNKADDVLYKIILDKILDKDKWDEKCLETIMKISELNKEETLKKISIEGSTIFVGDLLHTYLNLRILDQMDTIVSYRVIPDFPYARPFTMLCPDCGQETVYRKQELNKESMKHGLYCEKCKEWVMYKVSPKSQVDDTKYYLEAVLEKVKREVKEQITDKLQNLYDKKIEHDRIIVLDKARNIEDVLSILEAYNIPYDINPPYPYKVPEIKPTFKNEWTEEEIRKLIEANPGLSITVDELNALN